MAYRVYREDVTGKTHEIVDAFGFAALCTFEEWQEDAETYFIRITNTANRKSHMWFNDEPRMDFEEIHARLH